jgi:hypothetical protein
MYGETQKGNGLRAAVIAAAVTLLAMAWPLGAPLYAIVYPGPDAQTLNEAITDASLDARFEAEPITQFENATFMATVIYGTSSPNPGLPTVKVAWSNEAALAAQAENTFEIEPTSVSRQFLDEGTRRPNGGYELTWTWDVTPLVVGKQTLTVSILPTVVVEGEVVDGLLNINRPIAVTVDVHPVQHDFDEVLKAAAAMKTDIPRAMIVGDKYDISASVSLASHADTVTVDIDLGTSETSSSVTIVPASADPAAARMAPVTSSDEVVRRWTVISKEPGQVDLVFTATVKGQAASHDLERKVPKTASTLATERGPSLWEIIKKPVEYTAPFVALALAILGLWGAWKKRKAGEADSDDQNVTESSGDPTS